MADISIINKDNTDYNVKDAAGRLALAEVENKGAKNDFDLDTSFPSATKYHATASKLNGTVSIISTGNYGRCAIPYNFRSGTSVFSCSVSSFTQAGGTSTVRFAQNADGTSKIAEPITISGNGKYNAEIVVSSDTAGYIILYINGSGDSYANSANFSDLMICTKAEWDISHTYVPYAPTNRELYETGQPSYDFIFGLGTALQSGDNLNTYNEVGKIYAATGAIAATILNTPWTLSGFTVFTIPFLTTSAYMQFLLPNTIAGKWYRRRYTQGAWSAWIEYNEAAINGLLSNIDSSTTITAYADSLAKGHYTSFIANTNRPSDSPVADNTFIEIYIYSASTALIRAFPTGSVYGNQSFQKSKVSGVWRNWIKFEGTEVT